MGLGKIRQTLESRKGYSLVQLILVIIIILAIAAFLVPSAKKYMSGINQTNCTAEAAKILVELQKEVADMYKDSQLIPTTIMINDVVVTINVQDSADLKGVEQKYSGSQSEKAAKCTLSPEGDMVSFAFTDMTYETTWSRSEGWTTPAKLAS